MRKRRKEDRERRKNVCVHPHPCGLEPVNTFAEPIIKFLPLWLVSGSRQKDKAQAFPPHGTQGRGQRPGGESWGGTAHPG